MLVLQILALIVACVPVPDILNVPIKLLRDFKIAVE